VVTSIVNCIWLHSCYFLNAKSVYIDLITYIVDSVDERVVTAVAHGQPIAAEEDYVDVFVAATDESNPCQAVNHSSYLMGLSMG
jgi:hypothetical protein